MHLLDKKWVRQAGYPSFLSYAVFSHFHYFRAPAVGYPSFLSPFLISGFEPLKVEKSGVEKVALSIRPWSLQPTIRNVTGTQQ